MMKKSSEKCSEALAGLRRAAGVLCAFETERERLFEEVHKECFARTVDGAPSTAPSEILEARHESLSLLT